MAKPRVFLSSTYYDLYQSREDIERFVRSLGYDCVRHEAGAIAYSRDAKLEASAYREVELCDILVTVIGGKFGAESKEIEGSSITQSEITKALQKGIQVYIFVEQNTLTEYRTWKLNKENKEMKYMYADDVRIYSFLEKLYLLPQNNPITGFKTIVDVTQFLKEQWAGLFQRYLGEQQRLTEVAIVEDMKGVAATLREMVDFLSTSNKDKDEALQSILSMNHPLFGILAKFTVTPYRVFFTNRTEMEIWFSARLWKPADKEIFNDDSVEEWCHDKLGWIEFKKDFFDENGALINFSQTNWSDSWVQQVTAPPTNTDDDIPF